MRSAMPAGANGASSNSGATPVSNRAESADTDGESVIRAGEGRLNEAGDERA